MTTVGWIYFTGEFGASKDDDEAIYWNQRASDLGCATASYNMGFFYCFYPASIFCFYNSIFK